MQNSKFKPRVSILIAVVFCAVLCVNTEVSADTKSRDEVINKALECVSQNISASGGLGWDDVCYTDYAKDYEAEPVVVPKNKVGNITKLSDSYKTDIGNVNDEDLHIDVAEGRDKNFFYRLFDFTNPMNDYELGGELFSYHYEEPDFMELNGPMFGIFGKYTLRTSYNEQFQSWKDAFKLENAINVWALDARGSYGQLDYESNGTGDNDNEDHYIFEIRATFGEDIPGPKKTRITPYAGVGWRYLLDDNGGERTTTGNWTYDRESNYYYVPFGVEVAKDLKNDFTVTVTGEYDLFIDGEQISHFEDGPAGSNYDQLKNDQDDGFGIRGSVRLAKKVDRRYYFVETFVRYWHIDDSNVGILTRNGQAIPVPGMPGYVYGGLEPENKTMEIGLKAGVKF